MISFQAKRWASLLCMYIGQWRHLWPGMEISCNFPQPGTRLWPPVAKLTRTRSSPVTSAVVRTRVLESTWYNCNSVVLVIMGSRCLGLVTVLLVLGVRLEASDTSGPRHQWSSLRFMSNQASKRSAEDSNVRRTSVNIYFCLYWCYYCWQETAGDDMDLSASDTQYDILGYNDVSSSANMESRVAPNRRRRKYEILANNQMISKQI